MGEARPATAVPTAEPTPQAVVLASTEMAAHRLISAVTRVVGRYPLRASGMADAVASSIPRTGALLLPTTVASVAVGQARGVARAAAAAFLAAVATRTLVLVAVVDHTAHLALTAVPPTLPMAAAARGDLAPGTLQPMSTPAARAMTTLARFRSPSVLAEFVRRMHPHS